MRAILSRIGANPDILLDALAAFSIIAFPFLALWAAYGFGLPAGGDELMDWVR